MKEKLNEGDKQLLIVGCCLAFSIPLLGILVALSTPVGKVASSATMLLVYLALLLGIAASMTFLILVFRLMARQGY
jgi:hypothetical protein